MIVILGALNLSLDFIENAANRSRADTWRSSPSDNSHTSHGATLFALKARWRRHALEFRMPPRTHSRRTLMPTSPLSGPAALGRLLSSSARLAPSSAGLSAAPVPSAHGRLSSSGGLATSFWRSSTLSCTASTFFFSLLLFGFDLFLCLLPNLLTFRLDFLLGLLLSFGPGRKPARILPPTLRTPARAVLPAVPGPLSFAHRPLLRHSVAVFCCRAYCPSISTSVACSFHCPVFSTSRSTPWEYRKHST